MRNPYFHPWKTAKEIWQQRRQSEDNPKLNLNLGYYVHPSINEAVQNLE